MNLSEKTVCMVVLLAFCCCSGQDNPKKGIEKFVAEWRGRQIRFPAELQWTSNVKDAEHADLYSDNYKILLYLDTLGCTSCRSKLLEWKRLITMSDTMFSKKPEFIFVFQPKNDEVIPIEELIRQNRFAHPVILDVDDKIRALNHFPEENERQCFLLDRDNKVVMVGNPVYNPAVWELYKKIIKEGNARQSAK